MSLESDFVSIFEDDFPSKDFKLCKKLSSPDEVNFKKQVIYEGKLSVRKKSGSFTSRYYQLIDKKIVYYVNINKEKPVPLGYYDLLWFFKLDYNEYQENSKTSLYSFTLKKNGKYHEFFSTKKRKIKEWFDILKYFCINYGFQEIYEKGEVLGKGHFASVYKVLHKKSKMAFAAKVLSKDKTFLAQKTFVKNEIFILKKLSLNDYIVRLFEIYEDGNELVLIFELMEGGDLYEKIKTKRKYTEKEVFLIFLQLMKGLDYLHSKGVAHRDIKLQNVLLTSKSSIPHIKIADFSLAEEFTLNKMHVKCGTPGFMAPEIFSEESYDEKVDIFSAGIILYILLCGRVPFKAKDNEAIIKKNKLCEIKYRKTDWENVSKSGRKLVIDMTNRNPILRIQIPQILTSNFMMKYYYNDSIKELSEAQRKSRASLSQGIKKGDVSVDSQGQQGQTTKNGKKGPLIDSLEEVERQTKIQQGPEKVNFKDGASSNTLRPPSLDNTLRPHSSGMKVAAENIEGFRSADSLFLSNDELSVKSGGDLMSVTMRSSFSMMSPSITDKGRSSFSYTQKLLNGKLHSTFSNSRMHDSLLRSVGSSSEHKKSSSNSHSKSVGSHYSRRSESSSEDFNEDSVISDNKYYQIFKDKNPVPRLLQKLKVHFRVTKPAKDFSRRRRDFFSK